MVADFGGSHLKKLTVTQGLFNQFPYAEEYLQLEYSRLAQVSYAVCWHMSDGDPAADLWDEFCPGGDGVAVRTTPATLQDALVPISGEAGPVYTGRAEYINHKLDEVAGYNTIESLFVVDKGWVRENEARTLIYLPGKAASDCLLGKTGPQGPLIVPQARDPDTDMRYTGGQANGTAIVPRIRPDGFIQEILVDSQMTRTDLTWLIRLLKENNLADRVRWS